MSHVREHSLAALSGPSGLASVSTVPAAHAVTTHQGCTRGNSYRAGHGLELRGRRHGAAGYRRGVGAEVGCERLGLELRRLVEEVEVEAEGEEGEVERGVLRDESEELGEAAAVVGGVPLELLPEVRVERRRRRLAVRGHAVVAPL